MNFNDQAMRDQFDPSHPSYHNGIKTPIQVVDAGGAFGGGKVPEGMTELPPEGEYQPPPEVEYPPEYHKAMKDRDTMQACKKTLNAINATMSVLRMDFTAEGPRKDLQAHLEQLKSYHELWPEDTENGQSIKSIIEHHGDESFLTKQDNAATLKSETTNLVRVMGKELRDNLAEIKKIKKAAQNAAKAK
jgi:hypothetical protein